MLSCTPGALSVTNLADAGPGSLRAAIATANTTAAHDTIEFDISGRIDLTSGRLDINNSLSIDATACGQSVTIDGGGSSGVLSFSMGFFDRTGSLTLDGLTIQNGVSDNGGGVRFLGESLTIKNSNVINNEASQTGGGIFADKSSVSVTDSTISGNRAGLDGGGIKEQFGGLTVSNSRIFDNHAGRNGGGINASSFPGVTTIVDSTITGNDAGGVGGGVFTFGRLDVSGSTIANNNAILSGGGIWSARPVTIVSSTVSDNRAFGDGGGIYVRVGPLMLDNSTVSGNHSAANGGGIFGVRLENIISNSTVTSNTADGVGGGIHQESSLSGSTSAIEQLTIRNSIIAGNSDNGTAPDVTDIDDPINELTVEYSLIGSTFGSDITAATGTGNILNLAPKLGPLADNGGPTLTHRPDLASPAVDAGDNTGAPSTDQRGYSRIVGGNIDMGAVERAPRVIDIDIRQQSINLKSNGRLPVVLLTTSADDGDNFDFDATTIDTSTIQFGDTRSGYGRVSPTHTTFEDADGDGDLDLVLHFSMRDIRDNSAMDADSVDAVLSALTTSGDDVMGFDSFRIVPRKKR